MQSDTSEVKGLAICNESPQQKPQPQLIKPAYDYRAEWMRQGLVIPASSGYPGG